MSSKEWKCLEIHTKSLRQRNRLIRDIVGLMRQLKEGMHLKSYFFRRYSVPRENVYFIKLGLFDSDEKAKNELHNLLEKRIPKDIKPYPCDLLDVDGIPRDEIKCISCELFEKVIDGFEKRITIKQAFYLLHFLMNQLGYSRREELELYKKLEKRTSELLGIF